ncbi:hypothetical protein GALMADRAFT_1343973 [Galerina marginata CBS 339.88]|uniref:Secreted protein n=1 Tax=Galerina marginata (strain CBS 339.88) TaxID=685588 RepID=A0A067SZV8_GALM3|nr:hypothetical protein GALMADRAFT_1343973 [Galerina marginata CBS 339.88]
MKFINLTALVICVFTGQAIAVAVDGYEVQNLAARSFTVSLPTLTFPHGPTTKPPPPPPPPAPYVAFNVAPAGVYCGHGTTITCSPIAGSVVCKNNFTPKQASIVVTHAQGNCHISLYPENNQHGGVIQRLNTDTTGTCIYTDVAEYQSYGIYCD